MKATVYSISPYEKPYFDSNEDKGDITYDLHKEPLTETTISLAEGSDAIVVFANDQVNSGILEKLHELGINFIATRSMGMDHIDVEKAKELDIKVANVPHYSPHSVAEHSVALMLSLNRRLILADKKVREQNFELDGLVGFDMNGKTVGLLGAGEIGEISVKILSGFGCRILIYDLEENEELIDKYQVKYEGIEEVCKKSDIISIHAPLTKKTKHLIDKEKINLMKKGVMIINTARGAICKTEDLIDGLKKGQIGYLGMDVYEHEKGLFFENHTNEVIQDDLFIRLLGFKNVLITAHQAFLTHEAIKENMEMTIQNLKDWAAGEKARHEQK
ncbi:MAG: 2-hydroxyacid dehydrogenase [Cyclobacteriaceae bacterium]